MQTSSNLAVAQPLMRRFALLLASLLFIQVAAAAVGTSPPRIIPGCGAANGGVSATMPTTGLCAAGYVSSVPKTQTGNGFAWSCWLPGTPRSAIVACSAERVINGACGTASGSTTATAPTAALCATGQASAITTTATGYSWSCTATPAAQGGVAASCAASKPVVSVCGSANGVAAWDAPSAPPNSNLCAVGTPTGVIPQVVCVAANGVQNCSTIGYDWSCTGAGPANVTDVKCSAPAIARSKCGAANGVSAATPPTTGLCSPGQASTVASNANGFSWTCTGAASAGHPNSVSCSAPLLGCGSAKGVLSTTMPTANLCAAGTATAVTQVQTVAGWVWIWSCAIPVGGGGSTLLSCSAPSPAPLVNGACGTGWQTWAGKEYGVGTLFDSLHCASGTVTNWVNTTSPITWSCTGSGGGTAATCSKP